MKKIAIVTAVFGAALLTNVNASAQGFLKKLKDKASDVAGKALEKKAEKATGIETSESTDEPSASSGTSGGSSSSSANKGSKPTNKVGEGLKNTTPPDVNQQIVDAETAQAAGNFSEARYSIQQALLGIEVQMGKEILKSLPATVASLPKDTLEDRVTSTQWGWANLTIQRIYSKDDKQLTILIGNNNIYSGFMDIYFAGNYTQSNGDKQNFKQIKIKGNKAIIKYDDSEGYTILVQLGQAGMITFSGVNFANEQEITTAANTFDIDGIKKMLGEK